MCLTDEEMEAGEASCGISPTLRSWLLLSVQCSSPIWGPAAEWFPGDLPQCPALTRLLSGMASLHQKLAWCRRRRQSSLPPVSLLVTQAVAQVLARLPHQVACRELPDTWKNVVRPHPTQETAKVLESQPIGCPVCKPALQSRAHLGCLFVLLFLFPLPAASQLLTSFHRRFQNPWSKKMHMGSWIYDLTDNE